MVFCQTISISIYLSIHLSIYLSIYLKVPACPSALLPLQRGAEHGLLPDKGATTLLSLNFILGVCKATSKDKFVRFFLSYYIQLFIIFFLFSLQNTANLLSPFSFCCIDLPWFL